ncbi:MAG: branched-chain amino acid ABC transporter permease [Anaerolineae bacterium]|nr:branched-chain amino acid ABC transporter permease [Anaerolineae bacterium]
MAVEGATLSVRRRSLKATLSKIWAPYRKVPLLGWLASSLVAVGLELLVGTPFARLMGMSKVPVLFGFTIVLNMDILFSKPAQIFGAIVYVLLIYVLPIGIIARLTAPLANRIAGKLLSVSMILSVIVHLVLLFAVLFLWSEISQYRILIARLAMINIMLTLGLNVVNGYMGEFSCSHPGFMALGAYGTSIFTVLLFAQDPTFGAPLLPPELGPFMFPIGLILGGLVAALGALLIAIPSFKTRGDYLAIISLAFMFIVKSLFENLEVVNGSRGLGGQPKWADLLTVFIWTIACIWIINNFVRSTLGKALNAVRDGELAADAMTVNTRRTKMTAFLFAAFWAGVAGGLFAHVLGYVNPGMFGIQKLAELLAMVYLGGLNSVVGSISGAVGFTVLGEALRPLEIYKWIIIPLLLILVMLFRPTGLIAFREFDIRKILEPRKPSGGSGGPKPEDEVEHAAASS